MSSNFSSENIAMLMQQRTDRETKELNKNIKKIIGEKFRDFTLEFMERICKQILQNCAKGKGYWLKDDQVMRIAKEILDEDNKDRN